MHARLLTSPVTPDKKGAAMPKNDTDSRDEAQPTAEADLWHEQQTAARLLQAYADIYRRTAESTGRKSVLHEASAHASAELLTEARAEVDRLAAEVERLREVVKRSEIALRCAWEAEVHGEDGRAADS